MVNTTLEIQTHQFLQNLYYLTNQLVQDLQKMRRTNSTNVSDPNQFKSNYLQMLVDNFPQMTDMNQFYLQRYHHSANDSHKLLDIASILSIVLYVVLTLIGALFIDKYYRFRFNQVEKCFRFFGFIPHSFLEKLREYYK